MKKHRLWIPTCLALACVLGIAASPASAGPPKQIDFINALDPGQVVGTASLEGNLVSIEPAMQYDRARLTIKRRGAGIVFQKDYTAEAALVYDLTDSHGSPLADGDYLYEFLLVRSPVRDQQGDVSQAYRPVTVTGAFAVTAGALEAPNVLEESPTEGTVTKGTNHFTGSVTASGNACFGGSQCSSGFSPGADLMVIEGVPNLILTDAALSASRTFEWDVNVVSGGIFAIEDRQASTAPFQIEEGAIDGALYLDSSGAIGMGTNAPADPLHVLSAKTVIRLENTTSGTTWRMGDLLDGDFTFYIEVNGQGGPTGERMVIRSNGSVGIGESTPAATLHVTETDSTKHNRVLGRLEGSDFAPQFEYSNGGTGKTWRLGSNNSDHFVINQTDDLSVAEMRITPDGKVFINGTQQHPDYVFDESYELMSLQEVKQFISENRHLPGVVSSGDAAGKIDLSSFPLQVLEKVEELTLYTIQQDDRIASQQSTIDGQRAANESMRQEIDALKVALQEIRDSLP